MLYFLVIIIPFAAYMAYLIHQNNQLKKEYLEVIQGLKKNSESLLLEDTSLLDELQKNYVVSTNAIKKAENYLTALEDLVKIQKQQVISNAFKPKSYKLSILKKRLQKLNKEIKTTQVTQNTLA